jgi:hypothetical protein
MVAWIHLVERHFGMGVYLWLRIYWVDASRLRNEAYAADRLHNMAKSQARRADMYVEYYGWLNEVVFGRASRLAPLEPHTMRQTLITHCGELKWRDQALRRIVHHPLLDRFIRLWRRFVKQALPDTDGSGRDIEPVHVQRRE